MTSAGPTRIAAYLALLFVFLFASVLVSAGSPPTPFVQRRWFYAEKDGTNVKQIIGDIKKAFIAMAVVPPPNTTSIFDEIKSQGGSNAALLVAIAIHENGGRLFGIAPDKGYCTFQITAQPYYKSDTVDAAMKATKLMSFSAPNSNGHYSNADRERYLAALNTSTKICTEAGVNILAAKQQYARGKADPWTWAICAYGGQWGKGNFSFPYIEGYFNNGGTYASSGNKCPASEEVRILMKMIEQAGFGGDLSGLDIKAVPKEDDPTKSGYGDPEVYINGQKLTDILSGCADPTRSIAGAIAKAAKAYQAAAIVRVKDVSNQRLKADLANPMKNLHNKISSERCLDRHFTFLETIRDLLNGLKGLITSIVNYLKSLLNKVCQFVATTLNNALASVCLPLPKLSLSASFTSLSTSSKGCNGLSLANIVAMKAGTVSGSTSPTDYDRASTGMTWPLGLKGLGNGLFELPILRSTGTSSSTTTNTTTE
jgi:hypothetical protein